MTSDLVQFVELLMKWQMHQCMEVFSTAHTALDELCEALSKEMKARKVLMQSRMSGLKEVNPMMGLRGSRLGITEMQTKAIAEVVVKMGGEGISLGKSYDYKVGTVIEVPHGAGTLTEVADFYSFTNDLTQMTFGTSRDDNKAKYFVKHGLLEKEMFETEGVGELVRLTVRAMHPMTEVCFFGEHAATPDEDAG
ncbi:hypothetical protein PR001_g21294 [Phytophthora rubi]|uniref:PEP-utilising enzyme C-terminal domain-containing protein n=1 Tax=Phytophthora rubi TaxID=129364 RepID=A0A6A3J7J4_9STRA|nr:hypothetical protein PR001_g21294 [Phytophthora rubi]